MKMRKHREIAGYVLGGLMFVLLIPTVMWLVSGRPDFLAAPLWRRVAALILALVGLSLSVWSIVYMRRKGDGNPMDAFGHEVAPRTKHLMTEGPYRLSRNPMLSGSFIYYAGVCIWLWTWQALLVFVAFVAIMMLQVLSEEKRLHKDFGEEYEDYCRRTGRFWLKSMKL
jgi:protein-S-isoprenylcysteine O-methyltransferase Ste14